MKLHPAADLFPAMTADEMSELVADIRQNGLLEPVWVTREGELLDGRNRVAACETLQITPRTRTYTGDDPVGFSLSQNLKRRHLTDGQKAALAHRVLPLLEAEARSRMVAGVSNPGADLPQVVAEPPAEQPQKRKRAPRSRDKAAKATGASGRAVAQFKRLAEQAPDLAAKVEAGDMALDRAHRIVRDRAAEQRRVQQAKEDAAKLGLTPIVDIRHGDFRDVLANVTGVHAIITDPPYPREFLPLLGDLAAWADKALTEDGVLAVLFGQTYLPEVYRLLDGHRPYRWTMSYLTPGSAYRSHTARVQSNWKPVLVYGGGQQFTDVVSTVGQDAHAKDLHHWGQDHGAFHEIVRRLTRPGQTVADPFMGSGTTLLAAYAQGCNVIGADIDAGHVATAKERLA